MVFFQFVEKIQKKTFSKEEKLQMMQNIAEEFSVRWDSWAFEHKSSDSPARKYVSSFRLKTDMFC